MYYKYYCCARDKSAKGNNNMLVRTHQEVICLCERVKTWFFFTHTPQKKKKKMRSICRGWHLAFWGWHIAIPFYYCFLCFLQHYEKGHILSLKSEKKRFCDRVCTITRPCASSHSLLLVNFVDVNQYPEKYGTRSALLVRGQKVTCTLPYSV